MQFDRKGWLFSASLITMVFWGSPLALAETNIKQYSQAIDALKNNQHGRFETIVKKMGDHPIAGYTQYQYISGRLESEKTTTLKNFLDQYGYLKVSRDVRKELLSRAYKRNYWTDILKYYDAAGASTTEDCEYLAAKQRESTLNNQDRELLIGIWKRGKSQPDACDDAFAKAKDNIIDKNLVWQRIENAVRKKNYKFAQYLGRTWLSGTDVSPLIQARKDPISYLRTKITNPKSLRGQYALSLALEYLSVDEPDRALSNFNSTRKNHNLSNEDIPYLLTRLCYRLSINHHSEAIEVCDRVDNNYVAGFENESQWRVRAAIRQSDWPRLLEYLNGLSESDRADETWRYWQARALAATGSKDEAGQIFFELTKDRSLEGYLAADIIDAPYYFNSKPTSARLKELGYNSNEQNAPLEIVKALVAIDQPLAAKEQLAYSVRRVDEISQLLLSQYAHEKGWHLQAILATSRAGYYDDLDIRFPLAHASTIRAYAKERNLPEYWVAALIRQESIFTDDIRSSAGAIGLMQLMPATARLVSKKLGLSKPQTNDLIKPEKNIQLGSWYIMDLWQRLGDRPRATAGYNAGPNRSVSWTKRSDDLAVDQWIETIPFNETRGYVKRVMTYTTIYANKFDRADFNLTKFITPENESPIKPLKLSVAYKTAFVPTDYKKEASSIVVDEGPTSSDGSAPIPSALSDTPPIKKKEPIKEVPSGTSAKKAPKETPKQEVKTEAAVKPEKKPNAAAKVAPKDKVKVETKPQPKEEPKASKKSTTKKTKTASTTSIPKAKKTQPPRPARKVIKPFGKPLDAEAPKASQPQQPNNIINY